MIGTQPTTKLTPSGLIQINSIIGLTGVVEADIGALDVGTVATYSWTSSTIVGGTLVIDSPTAQTSTFSADAKGEYSITLTATNSNNETFVSTIYISIDREVYVGGEIGYGLSSFDTLSDAISWINTNGVPASNRWRIIVKGVSTETTQPLNVPANTHIYFEAGSQIVFTNQNQDGLVLNSGSTNSSISGELSAIPHILHAFNGSGFALSLTGLITDSNISGLFVYGSGGLEIRQVNTPLVNITGCIIYSGNNESLEIFNSGNGGILFSNNIFAQLDSAGNQRTFDINLTSSNSSYIVWTNNLIIGQGGLQGFDGGPVFDYRGFGVGGSAKHTISNNHIIMGTGVNSTGILYAASNNPDDSLFILNNVIHYPNGATGNSINSTVVAWTNAAIHNNTVTRPINLTNITLQPFTAVGSNIEH